MNGVATGLHDNGFVVGNLLSTTVQRLEFDGRTSSFAMISPTYTGIHHNIDPGKVGLLAGVDAIDRNGVANLESVLAEFSPSGFILKEWDFATLLSDYMRSMGDDPSPFIRAGIDWFHMNAATYDARDDSVIVSSRENFVIKVDYRTGALKWIFGDPTKYWYTFPSLRAKAIHLAPSGFYPIGQHATSITSDGLLMLFNNGGPSFNQPVGATVGEARSHSTVSAYAIDPVAMTAREVRRFDHGQSILSDICSSAYEAEAGSVLVSYATANNRTKARLVGLDAGYNVVFDFEYDSPAFCRTSWNAAPIRFDAVSFL
jgi:arylsulfate sulfotransferase